MDKCKRDPFKNNQFKYFNQSLSIASLNDNHPLLNCNVITSDITNVKWENEVTDQAYFKCVHLTTKNESSYLVNSIVYIFLKLFQF